MSAWLEQKLDFIRERRRQSFVAFMWACPVILAGILLGMIFDAEWLMIAAIVLAMALVVVFSIRCEFECYCPRCGNLFFRVGLFHNSFTNKCLHCGFSLDYPGVGGQTS